MMTSCGGYNSEKAADLYNKWQNDRDNFTESDAKAMLNQWKSCLNEQIDLAPKYLRGEEPQHERFNTIASEGRNLEWALGRMSSTYPFVYDEMVEFAKSHNEKFREIYQEYNESR